MELYEMFEGWESASLTAQIALGMLVELMNKQERDITFGTYAKGILKAADGAPEDIRTNITKLVVDPIAEKYARVAHGSGRWSGYDFTPPERIFEIESNFKESLYDALIEFMFSKGYQDEVWAGPIKTFTCTAPWKLEPYS